MEPLQPHDGTDGPGGGFFSRPLSATAIFAIVMGSLAGALVLALVVFILHKVYRRIRLLVAVHYLVLDMVEYPPEGAAYEAESAYASCAICLTEFAEGERVARLACGHLFLPKCIKGGSRVPALPGRGRGRVRFST